MKRLLLVVLVAALACAANPRAKLVQAHQGIQTTLAALDDAERRLCFGSTVPTATPNECHTDVATAIGLTNARHQAISAAFIKGYDAQEVIGRAIALWQPGHTIDLSVALDAVATVQQILAQMNVASPDLSPLTSKAQQWADELSRLKALFTGGVAVEVAHGR